MKLIYGRYMSTLILDKILTVVARISLTPTFSGLRNFPQGRNFAQWTGDDSKGLMKVSWVLNIQDHL